MLKLVAQRLLVLIPTLLGILLIALLLIDLMPGDPAAILAGEMAPPEVIQRFREQLHLDEPLWTRYVRYVAAFLQGDLGRSPGTNIAVWDRISSALPVTLSVGFLAIAFGVLLGVVTGTWAGLRRGRLADRVVVSVSSVLQAVPPFIIGLALVIVLAVDRSWLPSGGYVSHSENLLEWFRHLSLPALTLALRPAAEIARQTRGALVDTVEQDYILATRAKGLHERLVIGKHAAKNAATPVVTVLGLQAGRILGGAVVIELIFALPGFGLLALTAVTTRDIVLIQGVIIVSGIVVLASNLMVDITYGYFNPRTRS